MTKPDRRTSRTRRQLRDALTGLILEKGYESVKIEDITERADLGRTTFYLHYRDKEELLIECIDTIAEEIKGQIGLNPNSLDAVPEAEIQFLSTKPGRGPIYLVFCRAAENAPLYRIILSGAGTPKAVSRIRDIISEAVTEFFLQLSIDGKIKMNPSMPMEVVTNYFASALLGMINWWLEKGMPYPPEVMTENFVNMFFLGARNLLGMND